MSQSQRNQGVVQDAWKAFASHDADQISAVLTEDAEWLAPPGNATAVALDGPSHMVGKKAIVGFLAEDFTRFFVRDVTVTFRGFYADARRNDPVRPTRGRLSGRPVVTETSTGRRTHLLLGICWTDEFT
ncbi:nuclear transport factor 2 family protein [Streptomyces sp. OE57]|uniref:nuclear transport factor 2 family protein n=1 Tax=Streptomyces lacaronensis TaxID=3379885 RepID=UPI0039B73B81